MRMVPQSLRSAGIRFLKTTSGAFSASKPVSNSRIPPQDAPSPSFFKSFYREWAIEYAQMRHARHHSWFSDEPVIPLPEEEAFQKGKRLIRGALYEAVAIGGAGFLLLREKSAVIAAWEDLSRDSANRTARMLQEDQAMESEVAHAQGPRHSDVAHEEDPQPYQYFDY